MSSLIYYNQLDLYKPEWCKEHPELNKYSVFSKAFNSGISLVDRTNTVKFPVNLVNRHPMPKVRPFTHTFEELCFLTWQKIEQHIRTTQLRPVIMYSGGIDSTLIVNLMHTHASKEFKERVLIILNSNSIQENPVLYETVIKRNYKTESSNSFENYFNGFNYVITGEFADNVFGSLTLKSSIDFFGTESVINSNYKVFAFDFFNAKIGNEERTKWFLDQMEMLIKNCPWEIKTWSDYLWYQNFAMKWQAVEFRIMSHKNDSLQVDDAWLQRHVCHFWASEEWQQWSLNNPNNKIKDTWVSYKFPAKELIFKLSKDQEYLARKTKFPSLPGVFRYRRVHNFITDKFEFVDNINIKDYLC